MPSTPDPRDLAVTLRDLEKVFGISQNIHTEGFEILPEKGNFGGFGRLSWMLTLQSSPLFLPLVPEFFVCMTWHGKSLKNLGQTLW